MSVNLNQAARLAGKSKNTLLRAITSGKLTERRNDNGTYAFDEAELAKVFPPTGPGTDILEMEIEGVRACSKRSRRSATTCSRKETPGALRPSVWLRLWRRSNALDVRRPAVQRLALFGVVRISLVDADNAASASGHMV